MRPLPQAATFALMDNPSTPAEDSGQKQPPVCRWCALEDDERELRGVLQSLHRYGTPSPWVSFFLMWVEELHDDYRNGRHLDESIGRLRSLLNQIEAYDTKVKADAPHPGELELKL